MTGRSRRLGMSLLFAFMVGAVVGWPLIRTSSERRIVDGTTDVDSDRRAAAWDRWERVPAVRQPELLDRMLAGCLAGPPEAIVDAGRRLAPRDAWNVPGRTDGPVVARWLDVAPAADTPLVLRVMTETIRRGSERGPSDQTDRGARDDCPLTPDRFARWWTIAPEPAQRAAVIDLAVDWMVQDPFGRAAVVAEPDHDRWPDAPVEVAAIRRWHLAMAATSMYARASERIPVDSAAARFAGDPGDPGDPGDRAIGGAGDRADPFIDVRLVRHLAAADSPDRAVARVLAAAASDDAVPVAALLATRWSPATRAALEVRAGAGDAAADGVLQARSPRRDRRAADRMLARGSAADPFVQALAAWRGAAGDPDLLVARLDRIVVQPEVPPALVSLVAERHLPTPRAVDLARRWLADPDPRREVAGATLAALLGPTSGLTPDVVRAFDTESSGAGRLVLHLARAVLDSEWSATPSPAELAARAPRDLQSNVGLLRALAGDPAGLAMLTARRPPTDLAADDAGGTGLGSTRPAAPVAVAEAAIARLVPHWADRLGRPVGHGPRGRRLQADVLDAVRRVEAPHLSFDPATRRFAAPAPPNPTATPIPADAPPAAGLP